MTLLDRATSPIVRLSRWSLRDPHSKVDEFFRYLGWTLCSDVLWPIVQRGYRKRAERRREDVLTR